MPKPTQEQIGTLQKTFEVAAKDSEAMLKNIGISPEILTRAAMNAALTNPAILTCTPASLRLAVLKCAQRGLLPDGDSCAIVPYKGRAQLIMGYKGMADVIRRAIKGVSFLVDCVVDSDEFEYEITIGGSSDKPFLRHKLNPKRERPTSANVTAVYALAWMPNNPRPEYVVMFRSEIDHVQKTYTRSDSKAWVSEWAEQAKKTAFRRLGKYLPIRSGLLKAGEEVDADDPLDDLDAPAGAADAADTDKQEEEVRAAAAKPVAQPRAAARPKLAAVPPPEPEPNPDDHDQPNDAGQDDYPDLTF